MVVLQKRAKRKFTGGRYKAKSVAKRLAQSGSDPTLTKIGEEKKKVVRVRGGSSKLRTLRTQEVNLFDGKAYSKSKIVSVLENSANRHYVRRNILTKGTVIETERGKAKITNRPGQEGTVNAVLIDSN